MKLKGLVWFFAIALICISIWELSYTFVVRSYEANVKTQAERTVKSQHPEATGEDKNALVKARMRRILDSTKEKSIYPIVGTSYQKCKENELNLGLDLQGGMSVTMEVSLEGLLKSVSNNPKDPKLLKALQTATAQKVAATTDYITLFSNAFTQQNPGTQLASIFAGAGKAIKITDSDDKVISQIRVIAKGAINETYKILLKRIDKFGVAQPNINLDENKGIIQVELAGVTDKERVRKYLQASANLQFWAVYSLDEIGKGYENAAASLGTYLSSTNADSASVGDSAKKAKYASALIEVMTPMDIRQEKIPYNKQFNFITHAKDTAALNSYLSLEVVRSNFPVDSRILFGAEESPEKGTKYIPVYVVKTLPGGEKPAMDGESVEEAFQGYDEKGAPSIKMNMTSTGAKKWADLTKNNVGRPVAIALDDIVYTAPNVMGAIEGGQTEISGRFTTEEAQDLSNILKSGKTNAPAKIVAEQVVGPTLGEASVNGGMMAFGISFIVIFALMFLYYNTGGWVANISLILNLLFTVGVLSAMGFTLTAAGIAGLVLTVGLAVDTNVIIFERIKEELTKGKSYPQAVNDGYKRSLAPVIDAHVTTFLTAAILFIFGLGPVLGFATTQMLGIVLSLFCGILVSRLITDFWTNKNRNFNYFTGISKRVFKHASFKFIEYRKVAYGISVLVLFLGIGSYFNGFHEGVEFKGGRSYTVAFPQAVKNDAVRDDLKTAFGDYPIIKTVGDNSHLNITTSYKKGVDNADSLVQTALYQGLQKVLPGISYAQFAKNNILSSQTVQPTISEDLKNGAIKATLFAMLIIFLYIFARFRDWRYSVGTIVALLHDVLVTLAVFSFFKNIVPFPLEIDQHFIAAVLTVIGFSMNDTVIVFDRIREYSRSAKKTDTKSSIINRAINDTLSRTIMTSLTVFLTILILFIFGGEVTRGFAFAMLIGVITGTYSSIFVAAPILVDLGKGRALVEPVPEVTAADIITAK